VERKAHQEHFFFFFPRPLVWNDPRSQPTKSLERRCAKRNRTDITVGAGGRARARVRGDRFRGRPALRSTGLGVNGLGVDG